jgi:hypothetical protein
MLNTNLLTSTPDPHRLLGLSRLRLRLARPVRRDRCTPTLLLLSIGQERRVRALAMPPKPVDHLDRVYRCVGTMKEHKQNSKLDRISARIMRRCGHRRSVTGYRNTRSTAATRSPTSLSVAGMSDDGSALAAVGIAARYLLSPLIGSE